MKVTPNQPPDPYSRPASPYDVLDAAGLMSEVLHIADARTLAKLIKDEDLPVHRGPREMRWFVRGEVLDWLKSRCTSTAPDQTAKRAG